MKNNVQLNRFKHELQHSLQRESFQSRTTTIGKKAHVYTSGDPGNTLYWIESGQVKLLMDSPEGRECLLGIYTAGDIFGESCLAGLGVRLETAIAKENAVLKPMPYPGLLVRLDREGLLEGLVKYMTVRIADQQQMIANLVTMSSEQLLGKTLLKLAHKQNQESPEVAQSCDFACDACRQKCDIALQFKISQEELSEMVGTTRPRITTFMQNFRKLGLLKTNLVHCLSIRENKLTAYLAKVA